MDEIGEDLVPGLRERLRHVYWVAAGAARISPPSPAASQPGTGCGCARPMT